ncbi:nuclear transport factor 2 family protein [Xanthomonas translucens]|uniref:ketosteroid isomerase-related protein n=1 Tax=Xanthomonas campestris pv. translucens TaxID=343 RepID=UPI001F2089A0|nr:ketosteroid isomerase-related protein [Xanthomonas translucens]UKE51153.1 nuclear transport factor 2 family protein [Xanthomonas translucens]
MKIDGTREQDRAIELVLCYYDAFNRSDWAAMLDTLTDDVAHDLNQGARETGKDTFAAFLQRMNASYREQLRDIVVLGGQDGRRAAAEYVVHGQYHHTDEGLPPARGQTYMLPGGAFFDIRDGKIARVSNYYNLQDWIDQVSA